MRWKDGRRSTNIDDRRGVRVSRSVKGGGIGIILLALVGMYFGVDPALIMSIGEGVQAPAPTQTGSAPMSAEDEQNKEFIAVVLADTEDVWADIFRDLGGVYNQPTLVLFSGVTESACGYAQSATGPFYCPEDQKVYIDFSFYDSLERQLNSPGDFAKAYVVAHEVGHHVQELLGIIDKMNEMRGRVSKKEYNRMSVKLELQADCFAGLWANRADKMRRMLEPGDIEEALNAASQIGDDRLQQKSRGYVVPDSFTHGSSEQRVRWFKKGFDTGRIEVCDTFGATYL